jgi:hypothetical protein
MLLIVQQPHIFQDLFLDLFMHLLLHSSLWIDLPSTGHVINSSLSSTAIPPNKGKMNDEYLQHQSQSREFVASTMEVDSK